MVPDTRRGRSRGGACRRCHQFRGAKSAKFHREPPTPLWLFQNKVGCPPYPYKKFKRKNLFTILMYSAKHIWPWLPNSEVQEKQKPNTRSFVIVLDTLSQSFWGEGQHQTAALEQFNGQDSPADNDIGEFRQQLKLFFFKWHSGAKWLSAFMHLLNTLTHTLTHSPPHLFHSLVTGPHPGGCSTRPCPNSKCHYLGTIYQALEDRSCACQTERHHFVSETSPSGSESCLVPVGSRVGMPRYHDRGSRVQDQTAPSMEPTHVSMWNTK